MKKLLAMLLLGLASAGASANSLVVDSYSSPFWIRVEWHAQPAADGNCYTEPTQGLNSVWMFFQDFVNGLTYDNGPQPLLRNGNECIAVTYFSKTDTSGSGAINGYYEVGFHSIYGWLWVTPAPVMW